MFYDPAGKYRNNGLYFKQSMPLPISKLDLRKITQTELPFHFAICLPQGLSVQNIVNKCAGGQLKCLPTINSNSQLYHNYSLFLCRNAMNTFFQLKKKSSLHWKSQNARTSKFNSTEKFSGPPQNSSRLLPPISPISPITPMHECGPHIFLPSYLCNQNEIHLTYS